MFGKTITLIRLFGFRVKIDASWLILGLLITWTLARGLFPHMYEGLTTVTYWMMGISGALGLLVSIVFHEMWHSLVARRFGLPMKGITLFIFGGVAEMTEEPPSPKVEFFMAVAGPLSSLALTGLLFLFGILGKHWGLSVPVLGVVSYLAFLNLILAGFNLIPAFPLDGGRVLRSVLWGLKDNLGQATRIASNIGSGFGIILMMFGVLQLVLGNFIGGLWMFMIGMFMRGASQSSYQQLVIRRALEGEPVKKFMVPDPVTVSPLLNLKELIENYIYRHHYKLYPVVENGRLVGCVTLDQIKQIPKEERGNRRVADIVKACSPANSISPEEDAVKALSVMRRQNASRLMVVDKGELRGVITLKDILGFLALKVDLNGD